MTISSLVFAGKSYPVMTDTSIVDNEEVDGINSQLIDLNQQISMLEFRRVVLTRLLRSKCKHKQVVRIERMRDGVLHQCVMCGTEDVFGEMKRLWDKRAPRCAVCNTPVESIDHNGCCNMCAAVNLMCATANL